MLAFAGFFCLTGKFCVLPCKTKRLRAGSHCGGRELCCGSDPLQAENLILAMSGADRNEEKTRSSGFAVGYLIFL